MDIQVLSSNIPPCLLLHFLNICFPLLLRTKKIAFWDSIYSLLSGLTHQRERTVRETRSLPTNRCGFEYDNRMFESGHLRMPSRLIVRWFRDFLLAGPSGLIVHWFRVFPRMPGGLIVRWFRNFTGSLNKDSPEWLPPR